MGFFGLNLHYLPLELRAKFMDELYYLRTDSRFDEKTRISLSYEFLKFQQNGVLRFWKPAFKRYLADHVISNLVLIKPEEWDIALFLPMERFVKKSKYVVWQDTENH